MTGISCAIAAACAHRPAWPVPPSIVAVRRVDDDPLDTRRPSRRAASATAASRPSRAHDLPGRSFDVRQIVRGLVDPRAGRCPDRCASTRCRISAGLASAVTRTILGAWPRQRSCEARRARRRAPPRARAASRRRGSARCSRHPPRSPRDAVLVDDAADLDFRRALSRGEVARSAPAATNERGRALPDRTTRISASPMSAASKPRRASATSVPRIAHARLGNDKSVVGHQRCAAARRAVTSTSSVRRSRLLMPIRRASLASARSSSRASCASTRGSSPGRAGLDEIAQQLT